MYKLTKMNNENGVSLIEAAIALIFFSFIIISFISLTQRGLFLTADQEQRSNAVNLAKQKLETLKYYDGTEYTRDSDEWLNQINGPEDEKPDEKISIGAIEYTIYTNFFETGDSEIDNDPNIIPINVTIEWTENGEPMRISMNTVYYTIPIDSE